MSIVYYYILKENIDNINKGIEISKHSDRQLPINGELKHCILGLLNPKDDHEKLVSQKYICLEMEINSNGVYIFNKDLDSLNRWIYYKSAIPLNKYKFGTYRCPEVAIFEDIPHSNIREYNNIIGEPLLFDTSEKLYKNNLLEDLRQRYSDVDETLINIILMLLVRKGKVELLGKKTVNNRNIYIYQDNKTKKVYTIDMQEGNENEQTKYRIY